jgi:hypothetical protein
VAVVDRPHRTRQSSELVARAQKRADWSARALQAAAGDVRASQDFSLYATARELVRAGEKAAELAVLLCHPEGPEGPS